MKKIAISAVLAAALASTTFGARAEMSPEAPLTRAEALLISTRVYAGKTPEKVFDAISKLFVLADQSKDLVIKYPDRHTMIVDRTGSTFPLSLKFHWTFRVSPTSAGAEITTSGLTAGGNSLLSSPDVIDLFYTRLDYLLGVTPTWYSCSEFEDYKIDHSNLDALCFRAVDSRPHNL